MCVFTGWFISQAKCSWLWQFFPKTEKYVALFTGGDDSEMIDKRNRLREQIKANLVAAAANGKDLEGRFLALIFFSISLRGFTYFHLFFSIHSVY